MSKKRWMTRLPWPALFPLQMHPTCTRRISLKAQPAPPKLSLLSPFDNTPYSEPQSQQQPQRPWSPPSRPCSPLPETPSPPSRLTGLGISGLCRKDTYKQPPHFRDEEEPFDGLGLVCLPSQTSEETNDAGRTDTPLSNAFIRELAYTWYMDPFHTRALGTIVECEDEDGDGDDRSCRSQSYFSYTTQSPSADEVQAIVLVEPQSASPQLNIQGVSLSPSPPPPYHVRCSAGDDQLTHGGSSYVTLSGPQQHAKKPMVKLAPKSGRSSTKSRPKSISSAWGPRSQAQAKPRPQSRRQSLHPRPCPNPKFSSASFSSVASTQPFISAPAATRQTPLYTYTLPVDAGGCAGAICKVDSRSGLPGRESEAKEKGRLGMTPKRGHATSPASTTAIRPAINMPPSLCSPPASERHVREKRNQTCDQDRDVLVKMEGLGSGGPQKGKGKERAGIRMSRPEWR